jgi:hypothetical protein
MFFIDFVSMFLSVDSIANAFYFVNPLSSNNSSCPSTVNLFICSFLAVSLFARQVRQSSEYHKGPCLVYDGETLYFVRNVRRLLF